MIGRFCRVLLIVAACALPFSTLVAQSAQRYIVTSGQAINARTCPRLNCGVARTFAPGEILLVEAVVEGEFVSGSNRWLQTRDADSDLFVHSSLAAPAPETTEATSEDSAAADTVELKTVDTSRWETHTAHFALIKTPRGWMTDEEMIADEELMAAMADRYGIETDELIAQYEQKIAEDTHDLVLTEPFDGIWFSVWHEDLNGADISVLFLKRAIMNDIDSFGGEVIEETMLTLPAGEAIRLHNRYFDADNQRVMTAEEIFYIIVDQQHVFYIVGSCVPWMFEDVEPIFDTIAQEFRSGQPNT